MPIVAGVGAALIVIGWTDIALLWLPGQFGNPAWEFAAIGAHIDSLPLPTIGTAAVAASCLRSRRRFLLRGVSGLAAIAALSLVVLSVFYLLDLPVVLRGTQEVTRAFVWKAIAKCGLFAVVYGTLYTWLAVYLWKQSNTRA